MYVYISLILLVKESNKEKERRWRSLNKRMIIPIWKQDRNYRGEHPVDLRIHFYKHVYAHTWYIPHVDMQCLRERKKQNRIGPVDFTVMINRHRILIVLGLDGWGRRADRALYFGQYKGPPRGWFIGLRRILDVSAPRASFRESHFSLSFFFVFLIKTILRA